MFQTRLLAIGLIALVAMVTALVVLRDGSQVTAQPPDVFDRLDEVQDDLVRLRTDVEGVRSELTIARGELGAIRGDIAVVSDRLGRLTRALPTVHLRARRLHAGVRRGSHRALRT